MTCALGRVRQQHLPIIAQQLGQQFAQRLNGKVLNRTRTSLRPAWSPPASASIAGKHLNWCTPQKEFSPHKAHHMLGPGQTLVHCIPHSSLGKQLSSAQSTMQPVSGQVGTLSVVRGCVCTNAMLAHWQVKAPRNSCSSCRRNRSHL